MSENFIEKLIELVIDRIFFGVIVLLAGYWVNRRFEIFKNETNEKYRQRQLIAVLRYLVWFDGGHKSTKSLSGKRFNPLVRSRLKIIDKNRQMPFYTRVPSPYNPRPLHNKNRRALIAELENQLAMSRYNAELEFIERQISEFYWPIYLRLEKDNVMWKRIKSLSAEKNTLPEAASEAIEKDFILKNHQEIVEIIESKIHFAGDSANSKELINEFLKYIKHVEVYKTIRSIKELQRFNPIDLNEPFPEKIFPLVENNFRELQKKYEKLKKAKFSELNK